MKNKTTNIYTEWLPLINSLSDEDAGKVFKTILLYQNDDEVNCDNAIWLFIKTKIDEYNLDKRNKSNKRADAGRLGGLAKASNAKQNLATPSKPSIKENKIKENKIKENKEVTKVTSKVSFLDDNILNQYKDIWYGWLKYKSTVHKMKYKTKNGEQKAFTELFNLSSGEVSIAQKIVQQSIDKEYKGLFPIKFNKPVKTDKPSITIFNDNEEPF